ncbi:MAG: acylglycerol kinase family protein, partial [Gemmatimonadetes bacterium]|nr:acylglycerol kinase family protein [Gemmatimonadota bacterium]
MESEYPIPDSERYLVLLNPNAAGGQRDALRRRIAGAMASHRVPFDIVESTSVEDGLRVVRAAVQAGCKAVVAAGGDGTIALALRGTAGSDVPVALLP